MFLLHIESYSIVIFFISEKTINVTDKHYYCVTLKIYKF